MDILGKRGRRVAAWLRRRRHDDELREEIDAHIAARREALIDEGMDPREAAYAARRMFGNAALIREESRDMWRFWRLEALLQDVRFGARLLARTPLLTSIMVLSLASGIAAGVSVFAIGDAVLFRMLPVRAPEDLRAVRVELRFGGANKIMSGVPEPALATLQQSADFADYIGFRTADDVMLSVAGGEMPRTVNVEFVSPRYFETLGVTAAAGRLLGARDHPGSAAVVSERLWHAINGEAESLGKTVTLNGYSVTVVGVVRAFRGLVADRQADVFIPLALTSTVYPAAAGNQVMLMARLHPGITTAVAEERQAALYRVSVPSIGAQIELRSTLPEAGRGISDARDDLERPVILGLSLAGILVLVACANTSGLMLTRFLSRRGEFGVRLAIGASRTRLARQLSVEALLVALLAAVVGVTAGWLAAPLLLRVMPQADAQAVFDLRFDARLIGFTLCLAVACAAGTVATSLLRLGRGEAPQLLAAESRSAIEGSRRVTRLLIAAQVACSLLLAVGAISMARTLAHLRQVPLGFDLRHTLLVDVNASGLVEEGLASDLGEAVRAASYHASLHDRLAAVPGVARSTMAQVGVLTSSATTGTVDVDGFTPAADEDRLVRMFFIGPDYFETLGMPIVAGRSLGARDIAGQGRTVVVNERFARFFFGNTADAIGRRVNRDLRIVGVVSDARYSSLRGDTSRAMFVSYRPMHRPRMVHVVRTADDPASVAAAVHSAVLEHDSRLRPRVSTGDGLVASALARETFFATLAAALAALAVALACAGVYAAVAYSIARRRSELAVRLALGASGRDVMRLVLRDPLVTTIAGTAAGIPGAFIVLRAASSLLFDVSPFDPLTISLCSTLLVACSLLAAGVPACRAARIDPAAALRNS